MAFDFKKEYKEFYLPPAKPQIVTVPKANFIAVRGRGDPNEEGGEYGRSIGILYALAYTIKMSPRAGHAMAGYFEYVVPPLEGFWWQAGGRIDYAHKDKFCFISLIRLPDFVTEHEFRWAEEEATRKKGGDFSKAEFFSYDEGTCVQCMHLGRYDDEPETVARMEAFARGQGFTTDVTAERFHHEIYLSDARRVSPEKLKTVIRIPLKRTDGDRG